MKRRRSQRTLAPLRVLMTVDAVGDSWRCGLDLARGLALRNVSVIFAVIGPALSEEQRAQAEPLGEVVHVDLPLDWLPQRESDLAAVSARIAALAERHEVDLIHLNLPSQAAAIETARPVVVMSHGCVPTWFKAVRRITPSEGLEWQTRVNRRGISRADAVLAPSRSHADLMVATYGQIANLRVVHSAVGSVPHLVDRSSRRGIVAFERWCDKVHNGAVLDQLAHRLGRPLTMIGSDSGSGNQKFPIAAAVHGGSPADGETLERIGSAEVFVSASLYEPFGLLTLEAAARRTPLVLSDIPAHREFWEGAALLVPADDPAAYAAAIDKLASERQLREILAQLAVNRATRFSLARQATALRAVYDNLAHPAMSLHAG